MPRRTATLLTSTLLLIALLTAGVLVKVPYSELSPGPTVNTLGDYSDEPVLSIDGHETYEATGHLNMTTVRVTGINYRMNLLEAMAGWFADDRAVVPHRTLYPDDVSADEVEQENAEQFSRSQESAKVAALNELGIDFTTQTIVDSVVKDSPSEGKLHAGDAIVAVDGTKISDPGQVAEEVTKHTAGEDVVFTIVPADEAEAARDAGRELPSQTRDVTITTGGAQDDGRAIVGIVAGVAHTFPFTIDIELADVGGPSAGLMFSLGLIDKLSPEDLTGGAFVAGTGTIDDAGTVGPIGGVTMKTIAARDAGAEYFLTPKDNCAAAAADTPGGLTLVEVENLQGALDALELIRTGDTDALPRCAKG
ncbi:PDZ domain-containing protein [Streptomyces sp. JH002]|jgi:PDZ domain-containing protein|uniref:YlbL family protein n=1 Tax=Streptomyces TaxID=1883 RepID=UPI001907F4C4|nr:MULTISPECIES: PDZ domain-containing protein [unclassified Streptomyces]MCU4746801.1 PDZ domain-containing protein [Streptomyces sp. G-5]QQN77508.1 PDZ domain-containing protein [Streptomyces sp. XC 2026]